MRPKRILTTLSPFIQRRRKNLLLCAKFLYDIHQSRYAYTVKNDLHTHVSVTLSINTKRNEPTYQNLAYVHGPCLLHVAHASTSTSVCVNVSFKTMIIKLDWEHAYVNGPCGCKVIALNEGAERYDLLLVSSPLLQSLTLQLENRIHHCTACQFAS